ncbi:PAS domain-containing sensor histidine kinase [Mucilaginibacter sp. UR6-11]|uniref:sensor histidine kinase n=1 Tax=Mucilaginibacter sp. UR6-11 TaxID=1435644 RepID=UPI001E3550F8|nr:PAS domain-containing sensor histidine kinase [Mucilaginibacter sp. UR6-11]MCC8425502.1 PAS domain-containing sensor histidine kinase [Mucilaginibacter sp. UR6-11]
MTEHRISLLNFYEQLPVAVYVCNRNDELVEYNLAAASLFGVTPLTGSRDWYPSFKILDHEGHQIGTGHRPVTNAIKTNPGSHRRELRFRLPDGTDRYILVSSVAIRDGAGDYDGAIHTLSDITAQHSSESQQSLLAAIVDSSEDAIIGKDLDGNITSWNRGAERIFGYTAAEAIGQHVNLIIPEERLAEETRIIKAIREGKKVEHFETIRRTKAGKAIPISLTISPVRDASGRITGASKIARDITRQKQVEEQVIAYTSHLEDMVAQRTAELDQALQKERELGQLKSRFVSMASHEFRTPLSSVKLSASLIEKYAQPYADQHIAKHVSKIKNSVNDLSAILGDFLSLEKLESGKINVSLTEFDLPEFCQETTGEMQLLAKPGQQMVYRHSGTSDRVILDQHLLKNCLHNLLSNAIKYSGENTLIRLDTELNTEECRLSVADQGIGIPEADKPHLFSAFFRAGNTGTIQGTGLGLNIVARYASLMGGSVDFESRCGQGTTFSLYFPQPPYQ